MTFFRRVIKKIMNLFATHINATLAAKSLCNAHVIKMPSEMTTMLNCAFSQFNDKGKQRAYYSHPASIWVRTTKENFYWTIEHGIALCEEYSRRYKRRHASQDAIEYFHQQRKSLSFVESGLTEFARCFSEFKQELDATEPDTIKAYEKFYWLDKREFARWPSIRDIPNWWPDISDIYIDKSFVGGVYSKR